MPTEPQQPPSQDSTTALVGIDDLIGPYPALICGTRWNGWAVPRFTFDAVRRIAHDTQALAAVSMPGEVEIVRIHVDCVEIVREVDHGDHICEEIVGVVDADHDSLYAIGARAWAWSVIDAAPDTPTDEPDKPRDGLPPSDPG